MKAIEPGIRRVDHVSLREAAYREIKHHLLTRRFDPMTRLDTQWLEHQLGVSRTPLNEALQRLATEGFVEVRPRRGYFVRRPTVQDAIELFDLRQLHEGYAVTRVIAHATDADLDEFGAILERQRPVAVPSPTDEQYEEFSEHDRSFHRALVVAAGNQRLATLYDQLDAHLQLARVYYLDAHTSMVQTYEEHEGILSALRARDEALAQARLAAHLERFRGLVLKHLTDDDSVTGPEGQAAPTERKR